MGFNKISILGPGLLGGSLGMAIKNRKLAKTVAIWAPQYEQAERARDLRAADEVATTPREVVEGADLVVLCTPISVMPELAKEFRSKLKRDCLVTDVASTKYDVVKQLTAVLAGCGTYIGSHPMAGSEKEGIEAARENLFDGAVCILTPLPRVRGAVLKKLYEFWKSVGCQLRTMSPAAHDEVVALISHLPHLVAAALVNGVHRENPDALQCVGNGFLDMTRIASGSPDLWTGIVASNREEVRRSIDRMIEELEGLRRDIVNGSDLDLRAYLRRAKETRDHLRYRI